MPNNTCRSVLPLAPLPLSPQALLDVSSVNSFLSPLAISAASNRSLELVDLAVMRTVATVPDAHQRPVGCVAQVGPVGVCRTCRARPTGARRPPPSRPAHCSEHLATALLLLRPLPCRLGCCSTRSSRPRPDRVCKQPLSYIVCPTLVPVPACPT